MAQPRSLPLGLGLAPVGHACIERLQSALHPLQMVNLYLFVNDSESTDSFAFSHYYGTTVLHHAHIFLLLLREKCSFYIGCQSNAEGLQFSLSAPTQISQLRWWSFGWLECNILSLQTMHIIAKNCKVRPFISNVTVPKKFAPSDTANAVHADAIVKAFQACSTYFVAWQVQF